jgi:hypothetical protein
VERPFSSPGDEDAAVAILRYYGVPADIAHGVIYAPQYERDLPTVPLSRDFLLFLYRDRWHMTWADLDATPRWRLERDLAYMQLEGQARAWLAADADDTAKREAEVRTQRTAYGGR